MRQILWLIGKMPLAWRFLESGTTLSLCTPSHPYFLPLLKQASKLMEGGTAASEIETSTGITAARIPTGSITSFPAL
jgi:hypothetical protein